VIEAILALSVLNVLLQLVAVYQRHQQLRAHLENGDRQGVS
jgi:hypothetical protein